MNEYLTRRQKTCMGNKRNVMYIDRKTKAFKSILMTSQIRIEMKP
jgi:hypothetical protein